MNLDKESKIVNVSYNKGGSGGIGCKLSIPVSWLKDMGVTQDNRQVTITKDGNEIIIKKLQDY